MTSVPFSACSFNNSLNVLFGLVFPAMGVLCSSPCPSPGNTTEFLGVLFGGSDSSCIDLSQSSFWESDDVIEMSDWDRSIRARAGRRA